MRSNVTRRCWRQRTSDWKMMPLRHCREVSQALFGLRLQCEPNQRRTWEAAHPEQPVTVNASYPFELLPRSTRSSIAHMAQMRLAVGAWQQQQQQQQQTGSSAAPVAQLASACGYPACVPLPLECRQQRMERSARSRMDTARGCLSTPADTN